VDAGTLWPERRDFLVPNSQTWAAHASMPGDERGDNKIEIFPSLKKAAPDPKILVKSTDGLHRFPTTEKSSRICPLERPAKR
jgi:hypothetical protein